MLVYANHFRVNGADAEEAIFKAISGWLKEQLGFGLHPDQMRKSGDFNGYRGELRSWLRVYATDHEEPALYAWILKNPDDAVRGRQWITEIGLKKSADSLDLSCVVKTDEQSTLAARSPVMASQPRVIGYVVKNVHQANNAEFAPSVGAVQIKSVGDDLESYHALGAEIERADRGYALVIVSPTKDGQYLFNLTDLQQKLIGLGQVVELSRNFNSYDMANVIGQQRSAWGGAVNVLYTPFPAGGVRNRLFLADDILAWGSTQHERISHILAWVTNNTNIPRLREHVRPEGVMQLALRRRMQFARSRSEHMDAAQLRTELEDASKQAAEQARYFDELVDENSRLEAQVAEFKNELEDTTTEVAKKEFTNQTLKEQLSRVSGVRSEAVDMTELVELAIRQEPPRPLECLELIERAYGDSCIVLPSARNSAKEMDRFVNGRELLELLKRLVTDYRSKLADGGDSQARNVFGKSEYAAKESETVMKSKATKRQRTFGYNGDEIEMFRHLKIGVDDDVTRTIRVHFHWDDDDKKIVIGYCGKHLKLKK